MTTIRFLKGDATGLQNWPPLHVYDRENGRQQRPISQLVHLCGCENYTWLHWTDAPPTLIPRTLKTFVEKLPTDWFIRIHRNCLINSWYMERIEISSEGPILHLSTRESQPISRRCWSALREQWGLWTIRFDPHSKESIPVIPIPYSDQFR